MSAARAAILLGISALSCRGPQSPLDPAGRYAREIASLWWGFFAICVAVYAIVVGLLLVAAFRRRRGDPPGERRLGVAVATGVGATGVVLIGLLIASSLTGEALSRSRGEPRVTIEVTAQQWWWELTYWPDDPARRMTTANEVVIPAGEPVRFALRSRDVIHSLWIPALHGKRDLMPGHDGEIILEADRPGRWSGQCAEFCGAQHAQMRLIVRALAPEEFDRWFVAQQQPAAVPSTPAEVRGLEVFLTGSCPLCHTIGGTEARGRNGPDLTHLMSRSTLAAGSRPNVVGHLAGWIVDSQRIKPGNRMPPNVLPSEDLQALLAYLGSLR